MPLADKYVLIAGCRDEEMSYEYRPPEADGAVAHGALTYFLCERLRQAVPGTSYRDVFEPAAARVNSENSAQHPQMEGQADREIFGVADLTPMTIRPGDGQGRVGGDDWGGRRARRYRRLDLRHVPSRGPSRRTAQHRSATSGLRLSAW